MSLFGIQFSGKAQFTLVRQFGRERALVPSYSDEFTGSVCSGLAPGVTDLPIDRIVSYRLSV